MKSLKTLLNPYLKQLVGVEQRRHRQEEDQRSYTEGKHQLVQVFVALSPLCTGPLVIDSQTIPRPPSDWAWNSSCLSSTQNLI